jgi:trehalose 6-phosphate phosphatase
VNARGSTPHALEALPELERKLAGRRPAWFLDYDGTLTPIVQRPEDARLSSSMREVLRRLARRHPVAIISGRDRPDVQGLVGLDELVYAGSHGFDIAGPGGLRMEPEQAVACLPDLDAAQEKLRQQLADVTGARLERKRFALAVHYRQVAAAEVPAVEKEVAAVSAEHPRLRRSGGKKVFELRPDVDWDKGKAVLWLLDALGLNDAGVVPFYLGDDLTDEDAFRALAGRGFGIVVDPPAETAADYHLRNVAEVEAFLNAVADWNGGKAS